MLCFWGLDLHKHYQKCCHTRLSSCSARNTRCHWSVATRYVLALTQWMIWLLKIRNLQKTMHLQGALLSLFVCLYLSASFSACLCACLSLSVVVSSLVVCLSLSLSVSVCVSLFPYFKTPFTHKAQKCLISKFLFFPGAKLTSLMLSLVFLPRSHALTEKKSVLLRQTFTLHFHLHIKKKEEENNPKTSWL